MTFKAIVRIMSGFSLIGMFGCATPALMDVGRHKEEATKYNRAKMTKDAIVIGYDVKVLSKTKGIKQEKRWVKIPMDVIAHPDKKRGSVYSLSNLSDHDGEIPEDFNSSKDLPIIRLTAGQQLAPLRPVTQSLIITYSREQGDSEDFYFMGPSANGELYSNFDTTRETRNPWAYFLIIPALPFTIIYDSVAFVVVSITGIDTR